jgi:hypothetical protein
MTTDSELQLAIERCYREAIALCPMDHPDPCECDTCRTAGHLADAGWHARRAAKVRAEQADEE